MTDFTLSSSDYPYSYPSTGTTPIPNISISHPTELTAPVSLPLITIHRQPMEGDVVVPARRHASLAAWSFGPDFSQPNPSQQLLQFRPHPVFTQSSTPQIASNPIAVVPSDLAYYRLVNANPASLSTQEGEFDIMLTKGRPGPNVQTETCPVVWDKTGISDEVDRWGDIPTTDFQLTRSTNTGAPMLLSVVSKENGGSGKLPNGNFFLRHRSELQGWDLVDPAQSMPGGETIAGPIFLETSDPGYTFDDNTWLTHGQGKAHYFAHPSLPSGKEWLTPEEEASRWGPVCSGLY